MENKASGNLYIVAAPSGGGKTSLVRQVRQEMANLAISISHTTRPKRPIEVDGQDYFFTEEQAFMRMVEEGKFAEHARVFGHYYGTSKAQIESQLEAGVDLLFDIDWQGAHQLKRHFPQAVLIFVIPPSLETLEQRLSERAQDNEKVIDARMRAAQDEMGHYAEFDYLIVNETFDVAKRELMAIINADRLSMARQAEKQRKLLSFLLSSR